MDKLEAMRAFLAVAETGSFTSAAEHLGLARSAITKRVQMLESELGTQLLHRTTRKVGLTDDGRAYQERCASILAQIEAAEAALRRQHQALAGRLRLSAPTSYGQRVLGPLLARFQEQHPALDIEVMLNDRPVNPVQEGYDLCIDDSGALPDYLVQRPLRPMNLVMCASPGYLARYGTPRSARELERHTHIHYALDEHTGSWRVDTREGKVDVRIRPVFSSNNGHLMLEAARRGMGIARLPDFLVEEDLATGLLQPVLPAEPRTQVQLRLVYARPQQLAARVRLAVDFLIEHLGPSSPPLELSAGRLGA